MGEGDCIHVAPTAGRGYAEGRWCSTAHDWQRLRGRLQGRGGVSCTYARMESVTALSASCKSVSWHLHGIDKEGVLMFMRRVV